MPFLQVPSVWLLRFGLLTALLAPKTVYGQRDLKEIPEPNPAAERKAMKTGTEAEVNLFAADPDLSKPIQVNFDREGGLWIASSEVYPQIQPGEVADDKIIVLRDTDGDGVADQRTVFADGLLIPTGVVPDGPNAAYVAESTRLLYLQDTDGDGKSDRRRVVFSGFGTEDTHHLVHTLRWGPDGCLYFNQSIYIHSHIDTPFGTRHLDGGGIWRYRPSTGRLEVFCKGFVNPWGHVFDEAGESFATDGAYFEGINFVFPDAVFVTSPGATRFLKGMSPGSPKHCGLEILSGSHIPPDWAGQFVTNDFRSHRVCRFSVEPQGSGYAARQHPEILTSSHVAFRPIDARMGPDGALYIADWYNPIIQHGEVDFRDERRDRTHGRIWRVSFADRELDPWPDVAAQSIDELLDLLEDPALAVRQFARQALWRRGAEDADALLDQVRRWRDQGDRDRASASRCLELLWLSESVQQLHQADVELAVSRAAADGQGKWLSTILRSAWRNRQLVRPESYSAEIESLVMGHSEHVDPRVRLEAVIASGQLAGAAAVESVIQAIGSEMDDSLDFATWQSLRRLDATQTGSVLSAVDWEGRESALAYAVSALGTPASAEIALRRLESSSDSQPTPSVVSAIAGAGDAKQLGRLLKTLLRGPQSAAKQGRLEPLFSRTRRDGTVPAGASEALLKVISEEKPLGSGDPVIEIATAAEVWKVAALEPLLVASLDAAEGQSRSQIIAALGAFDSDSARQRLASLSRSDDAQTRIDATRAIAARRPRAALEPMIALLTRERTRGSGEELIAGMVKRKGMPALIADKLRGQALTVDGARSLLARVKSAGGHASLEEVIRAAGKLADASWKLTPALSSRILARARNQGSPARGESVYRRQQLQCIQCHAIGTAGGKVGPNLISVGGSSQPDYILESLIDPSAKLKEGFTTQTILTEEGEVINGIVVAKTDRSLRLRLADGKEREIASEEISVQKPGKSLMPAGALDGLTEGELADLVAFLSALGRTPRIHRLHKTDDSHVRDPGLQQ